MLLVNVLGAGRVLLSHPGPPIGLTLVDQELTNTGLVLLQYTTAGDGPIGEYDGVTTLS